MVKPHRIAMMAKQAPTRHFGDGIRSIVYNGVRFMGVGWIETVLNVVYFAVMARYLGPARYGQWAYGIAAYMLVVGLAGFGFNPLMLMRLGRDKREAGRFIGLTLTLRLGLLGIGAVGLAAYALAAAPDPVGRIVLLLLIPALVGRGVALWARLCFLAYERMGHYLRIVTVLRGAEAICGTAYLVAGGGLLGVVVLHSLSWLGEALFGLWRIHSRLTGFALCLARRPAIEFLSQGAILGLAAAGYTWLVSGPIMILRHVGFAMPQLGQFAIVLSLTMTLVGSAQAFFFAALPVLSRSAGQAGGRTAAYGRLAALTILAAATAAAGMGWLLGGPVAQWALGERYSVAGGLLGPFALIGGLVLAPMGYDQSLVLSGRRWPSALASLSAGVWLAGTLPVAAGAWRLQGAVLATAGAWLLRAAVLIAWGEFSRALRHNGAVVPRTRHGERSQFRDWFTVRRLR